MNNWRHIVLSLACAGVVACGSTPEQSGETLSKLEQMPADVEDIYVADSLERAAESYRRYLDETAKSAMTPEAMRRLADLQIEQAYGVMGSGEIVEVSAARTAAPAEMAAPDAAGKTERIVAHEATRAAPVATETEQEFEDRATSRELLIAQAPADPLLPDDTGITVPQGPREAIEMVLPIINRHEAEFARRYVPTRSLSTSM